MNRRKSYWVALFSISTIYFFIIFYLVYHQIYDVSGHYMSDTFPHMIFLYKYFYTPDFYIPHPLWHISTFILAKTLHINMEISASLTSGIFVSSWAGLIYFISSKMLKQDSWMLPLFVTVIITVVGPLCIPWYKKIIFFGQGSPNIWHNVTLWTVKPFALLATWYTIRFFEKEKTLYALIATISALMSVFAKPSFIIVFLPALFIFFILHKLYKKEKNLLFLSIVTLATLVILTYQYFHTFREADASHIIFDPLGVWSLSSRNITMSIFLGLAFPLVYTILKTDIINRLEIQFTWLMVFFGILLFSLFAQTGKYYSHGNFGWSYMISMSLLYLFTILEYVKTFFEIKRWKRCILTVLLGIQVMTGIYYLFKVLQGQNPLYISIIF